MMVVLNEIIIKIIIILLSRKTRASVTRRYERDESLGKRTRRARATDGRRQLTAPGTAEEPKRRTERACVRVCVCGASYSCVRARECVLVCMRVRVYLLAAGRRRRRHLPVCPHPNVRNATTAAVVQMILCARARPILLLVVLLVLDLSSPPARSRPRRRRRRPFSFGGPSLPSPRYLVAVRPTVRRARRKIRPGNEGEGTVIFATSDYAPRSPLLGCPARLFRPSFGRVRFFSHVLPLRFRTIRIYCFGGRNVNFLYCGRF